MVVGGGNNYSVPAPPHAKLPTKIAGLNSKIMTLRVTVKIFTNSLTPYTRVGGFFLSVKFATSLLASLAGG